MKKVYILLTGIILFFVSCTAANFTISSNAYTAKPEKGFDSGLTSIGRADPAYNGDVSLPFTWANLPSGTKALALVYDDPDARLIMKGYGVPGDSWVHWLVTDIDPSLGGLPADAATTMKLIMGNDTGGAPVYGGPAPPSDLPADAVKPIIHIYRLTVYALSEKTNLPVGFSKEELVKAMEGKILSQAQLNLSWSN